MTENVRKLVGVVVMAALVVVGVVATSGGDDVDFTRNAAFTKLPAAQRARLAPAFAPQAASKASIVQSTLDEALSTGKAYSRADAGIDRKEIARHAENAYAALGAGKASVLEGRGPDGKGGTSSIRLGTGMDGKTGKAGIWSTGGAHALSGRKASIRGATGMNGVADRLAGRGSDGHQCASGGIEEMKERAGASNVVLLVVTAFTTPADEQLGTWTVDCNLFREHEPLALAECMESKVGEVFLKSHIKASAANCVATVMPALSPDRAKQLGTYWQTQQQLICVPPTCSD